MVWEFFTWANMTTGRVEQIVNPVGLHHTYTDVSGMDHQIFLEPDYYATAIKKGISGNYVSTFPQYSAG